MKTLLVMTILAVVLLWFANNTIQSYGLMVLDGDKWSGTTFTGWDMFKGLWVLIVAVSATVALVFAGLIAWLRFDFEQREEELKTQLAEDKQKDISELEKIHASQIENLFHTQSHNSKHLENAYADVKKYKRMLVFQEGENKLLVQKIKGKDAVIMRLKRKIDRLPTSEKMHCIKPPQTSAKTTQ